MTKHIRKYSFTIYTVLLSTVAVFAQDKTDPPQVLNKQTDAKEVISSIFRKQHTAGSPVKKPHSNISILPSAGYNPSIGFAVGATSTGGKTFGNPNTTTFSVVNANAYIATKGLAWLEAKHNIFTNNNKYNIVGTLQTGKTVALDYGVGTGSKARGDGRFIFDDLPLANNPDVFQIKYTYIKFSERIYRKIIKHVYAGAGVVFNSYYNIDDEDNVGPNSNTHNFRYNTINNFPTMGYASNGFLVNVAYNSRDHLNRPYKGLYADVVLTTNTRWLGSQQKMMQLKTELRKYWSLSKINPEHVLSFWYWGCYLLNGKLPYLELPGTGSDRANRIGRGYTIGRFKGLSFIYSEMEYRFPITKNKLFSGVLFTNIESASNSRNAKLMQYFEPGSGLGLRLLFNKYTRSNLCIDYGMGNYGSKGLFLGLNEVF